MKHKFVIAATSPKFVESWLSDVMEEGRQGPAGFGLLFEIDPTPLEIDDGYLKVYFTLAFEARDTYQILATAMALFSVDSKDKEWYNELDGTSLDVVPPTGEGLMTPVISSILGGDSNQEPGIEIAIIDSILDGVRSVMSMNARVQQIESDMEDTVQAVQTMCDTDENIISTLAEANTRVDATHQLLRMISEKVGIDSSIVEGLLTTIPTTKDEVQ